jgi:hypothetical protein
MYDDEILAISGKERPIHPDAIFVSPTTWTVKIGKTLTLTASVTPAEFEFPIIFLISLNILGTLCGIQTCQNV